MQDAFCSPRPAPGYRSPAAPPEAVPESIRPRRTGLPARVPLPGRDCHGRTPAAGHRYPEDPGRTPGTRAPRAIGTNGPPTIRGCAHRGRARARPACRSYAHAEGTASPEPTPARLIAPPPLPHPLRAMEVQSAAQVWVPGWLFLPRGRKSDKPVVLALDPGGRNREWSEGHLYQSLAVRGFPVCVPDLRGIGDLRPEFARGNPGQAEEHEQEDQYAWAGLILGRPLVGQRVSDILALVAGCKKHPALEDRRVVVAARGKLTVPALIAAALDSNVSDLYLAGGLVSFRNVMD